MRCLMKSLIGVVGLLSFSVATALASPGWSDSAYVTRIDQQNDLAGSGAHNGVWIMTDGVVKNDNCGSSPVTYFLADEDYVVPNTKYKSDFAMLMAAYLSSRPISFYVEGCYSSTTSALVSKIRVFDQ